MGRSATSGLGWHLFSMILVFIASILLFLVVLLNIPLPFDKTPSVASVKHRAWLIGIGPADDFLGVPRVRVGGENLDRRQNPTTLGLGRELGLHIGFGIWGWCEWTPGPDEDDRQAICVNHPFYHIPNDAPFGDPVVGLDLPYSIRSSLSIASFFLVIALAGAVVRLFVLAFALADPPYEVQPREGMVPILKPNGMSGGTYHSLMARNLCLGLMSTVFLLAWTLPTLIVVAIAIQSVRDHHSELRAWFGWGSALVVVSIVLLSLSYLFNMAGGTYVNTRMPAAAKPSKRHPVSSSD